MCTYVYSVHVHVYSHMCVAHVCVRGRRVHVVLSEYSYTIHVCTHTCRGSEEKNMWVGHSDTVH